MSNLSKMILTQFEHEDQSHLIDVIREKGIEGKAGVLGTSFATEYRPWRAGSDVFEKVSCALHPLILCTPKCMAMTMQRSGCLLEF